jgi:excisionase family DNA binding protein
VTDATITLTDQQLALLADLVAGRMLATLAVLPPTDGPPRLAATGPTCSLLTAEEVADMLGVTTSWVYAESRAGRITTVKLGRYYRYRLEAIERWIASQEVGG